MNPSSAQDDNDLFISADELLRILEDDASAANIIDVRGMDFALGQIPGTRHVPADEFDSRLPRLVQQYSSHSEIVITCMYGEVRSPNCARKFRRRLEEDKPNARCRVRVLKGGFSGWQSRCAREEHGHRYIRRDWLPDPDSPRSEHCDMGEEDEDDNEEEKQLPEPLRRSAMRKGTVTCGELSASTASSDSIPAIITEKGKQADISDIDSGYWRTASQDSVAEVVVSPNDASFETEDPMFDSMAKAETPPGVSVGSLLKLRSASLGGVVVEGVVTDFDDEKVRITFFLERLCCLKTMPMARVRVGSSDMKPEAWREKLAVGSRVYVRSSSANEWFSGTVTVASGSRLLVHFWTHGVLRAKVLETASSDLTSKIPSGDGEGTQPRLTAA